MINKNSRCNPICDWCPSAAGNTMTPYIFGLRSSDGPKLADSTPNIDELSTIKVALYQFTLSKKQPDEIAAGTPTDWSMESVAMTGHHPTLSHVAGVGAPIRRGKSAALFHEASPTEWAIESPHPFAIFEFTYKSEREHGIALVMA